MEIFKNELIDILSTTNPKKKKSSVIAVWVYRILIEQNAFLQVQKVSQNLKFETNILKFCEFQYFAWYGDYMKIIPIYLWQHACEMKTGNQELFLERHYWSDIAISLKNKDATLKNIRFNNSTVSKAADYCTYTVICNSSRSLGISKKQLFGLSLNTA